MKHGYLKSQLNESICRFCKRPEIDHTDKASCECCSNIGTCELYVDILMCADCESKELAGQKLLRETEQERVDAQKVLIESREKDQTIQIPSDIYNAKITPLAELIDVITQDESIKNKHFAIAKAVDERYKHLSSVLVSLSVFSKQVQKQHTDSQIFYNELAKKLSQEERAKISIRDVNYQPVEVKTTKPRAPSVKKYDKEAVRTAASESKLPEAAIQMICVAKNVTPVEAVRILRESGLR